LLGVTINLGDLPTVAQQILVPAMQNAHSQPQQFTSLNTWSAAFLARQRSGIAPSRRGTRQPRRSPPPPPAASAAAPPAPASAAAPPAPASPTAPAAPPHPPLAFPPDHYDPQGRLLLKCLDLPQLEAWCASLGEDPRRATQLWRWMYADRKWLRSLEDAPAGSVQNGFSDAFRAKAAPLATLDGGLELASVAAAADGTRKLVFRLTSGPGAGGQVETVVIPIVREAGTKRRVTLCVSSQVGCAQGCTFCWTGRMGLRGNLSAAQIVEQVVAARRMLWEEAVAAGADPESYITPITNVVYMASVMLRRPLRLPAPPHAARLAAAAGPDPARALALAPPSPRPACCRAWASRWTTWRRCYPPWRSCCTR
jgi:hypothetical protein